MKAVWVGDFRGIRGLLLCPGANINVVDKKGRTPLYLASWLGHNDAVEVLLKDKRIEVNKGRKIDGVNPFAIASEEGHFEIMEKLMTHEDIDEGKAWNSHIWTLHLLSSKSMPRHTEKPATDINSTSQLCA